MTFLLPAALLTFLLAAGPVIAHALRRGRAVRIAFPAARLVAEREVTAQKQQRLEDRGLLLLRVLLILGLAVLGASPLLSCSRLSLARTGGSSVAVALVVDDSASMRAAATGESKFALALSGARQLLDSARPGDAFSIILAGKPARVLTPATTDLASIKQTLDTVSVSDRSTDVAAAVRLAEGTLDGLPQEDKQLVVLSDLATQNEVELPARARLPLDQLARPLENCSLSRASIQGQEVIVEVGCTSAIAAQGRSVELLEGDGTVAGSAPIADVVTLSPKSLPLAPGASARLTPPGSPQADHIEADDVSPVLPSGGDLLIGVRADEERSGLRTSNSTVLGTALLALETQARVQPLTLLPTQVSELEPYAALLIDDPPGFTPETAEALERYVEQGGTVLAFLGPSLKSAPLGSTFRPLLDTPPSWSRDGEVKLDPEAELGLGPITRGWSDFVPKGRAILGSSGDARPLARFSDGAPLLLERSLGRGLLLVSALPTSLDESDFALRPAFLALLDHAVHEAGIRHGSAATECGTTWELPLGTSVEGPEGPLEPRRTETGLEVVPTIAGLYRLRRGGTTSVRYAVINPQESLLQPKTPETTEGASLMTSAATTTEVSREVALIVLFLAALELGVRLFLGRRARPLAGTHRRVA